MHPRRALANHQACPGGWCCYGACLPVDHPDHCGGCGIRCGAGRSCVANPDAAFSLLCTCVGNADCYAGYGGAATCYTASGLSLCNCQCASGTQCAGQCAGGQTCNDVPGHNACYP
ncbi:MAG: hypothetical protein IPI55_16285 [Flavobacteriales bacterium]|nr:hypothetical protein [Flavobacteriales bacterium]